MAVGDWEDDDVESTIGKIDDVDLSWERDYRTTWSEPKRHMITSLLLGFVNRSKRVAECQRSHAKRFDLG